MPENNPAELSPNVDWSEENDAETPLADMDASDLLGKWYDRNHAHSFEGDTGVDRLGKLVAVLGKYGHQFKYGDPVQHFLSDNSGAIEVLLTWIEEQVEENPEWKENLVENLQADDETEDDGN